MIPLNLCRSAVLGKLSLPTYHTPYRLLTLPTRSVVSKNPVRQKVSAIPGVAHWCFENTYMQELKVWSSFIHLTYRHAFDRVALLPERLLYPFKNLSQPAIFLRVAEKHPA